MDNQQQIDELVKETELAGITLCYAALAYRDNKIDTETMNCYRDTFASEILFNNNLAIMETCKNCQGGYVIFRTNKTKCPQCHGLGVFVIPLKID